MSSTETLDNIVIPCNTGNGNSPADAASGIALLPKERYIMNIAAGARQVFCLALALSLLSGCYVLRHEPFHPVAYDGPKYSDPAMPSELETSRLESNDLVTACGQVVGKILANPDLANEVQPPRYRISPDHFVYEGSGEFNTNTVVNLLRSELKTAAAGRVVLVEEPLRLATEDGETAVAVVAPESDYVLVGRISDLESSEGFNEERYTQLAFELVSVPSQRVVLSDLYHVRKTGGVGHDWK
jgi:hypothetical protein